MAKSVADVIKMVKEDEVKFVDFRFTDTRGKEQHVTVPVSHFDEDKFTLGHAFDGSSIAGWKGIEASDMLLMPDPNTANIDPFFEEPTLILTCDVVEPADGKPYERDPRSLAKRAEAYMKASGLGDTAYFGPEPEFFVFDSVRWGNDMSGCFSKIESEEAAWNTGKEYEHGNSGYRPTVKGGYFPTPPVDSFQDMRSEMCLILESLGIPVEVHHHEVANAGQMEIGTRFSTLLQRADWVQDQWLRRAARGIFGDGRSGNGGNAAGRIELERAVDETLGREDLTRKPCHVWTPPAPVQKATMAPVWHRPSATS